MIAIAERPPAAVLSGALRPPAGAEAGALALAYMRHASACWRGDPQASVFKTRLGAFWCPDMPPVPATVPDAISPHGGGGRGIHWRQIGNDVLGHVPGARGGYQIPVCAIPRLVECASSVSTVGGTDWRTSRIGKVA